MEKLNLVCIKVNNEKYCIAKREAIGNRYNQHTLHGYLFDGKTADPTFKEEWMMVGSLPKKISIMRGQNNINHRYELTDKELVSEKLPLVLKREDVATQIDCEWRWNKKMCQYSSLYKEYSDKQPDMEEIIEFELEEILSITEIAEPTEFGYNVQKTQWSHEGTRKITAEDVNYKMIERIFYPNILLPQRPCFFTSTQSYKIVREFIKDNIDGKFASITSDYDFCFTVKRRIPMAKIKEYTVDTNNSIFQKRKRKPKYVKKQQSERLEQCFEMTNTKDNYKDYTPIKGFEAPTQKELKEKIDVYCKELIGFINTSFSDCPHCNGDGVLLNKVNP